MTTRDAQQAKASRPETIRLNLTLSITPEAQETPTELIMAAVRAGLAGQDLGSGGGPFAPLPQFLTAAQVAEKLQVTPAHVRRLMQRGVIPCYHIGEGRAPRVKASDLAALMETWRG